MKQILLLLSFVCCLFISIHAQDVYLQTQPLKKNSTVYKENISNAKHYSINLKQLNQLAHLSEKGTTIVKLPIEDSIFNIVLQRNWAKSSSVKKADALFYKGYLVNNPNSIVRLSLIKGNVLEGYIHTGNNLFYITLSQPCLSKRTRRMFYNVS